MDITPELLLHAYSVGVFPMAESRDAAGMHWMQPARRGVFDLNRFHISRSLRKRILQGGYQVAVNRDFAGTVAGCAARDETWINAQIFDLYGQLHAMGHAHSVEVYHDDALIGGVYGVAIGGAFFGESMFSTQTDASKIALAYLVHRLRAGGFVLFDTQYLTPHLASLGAVEIARAQYELRLAQALPITASFTPASYCPSPSSVVAPSAGASPSGNASTAGKFS